MRVGMLVSMAALFASAVCTANAATLTTSVSTNAGCEGIFFDVTAKSDAVTITGLESVIVGSDNVSVYYKAGGYGGFETSGGAWTLLNIAPVTGGSGAIQTLYPINVGAGVTIPAGQTYGFLIWMDNSDAPATKSIRYSYDVSNVTDTTDNSLITIFSGTGSCGGSKNDPFDGVVGIRPWRGSVIYSVPPKQVPTLSEYGLMVLSSLLVLGAASALRRRS